MAVKKYTLAEAKRIFDKKCDKAEKVAKKRITRKTKSKTKINGHTIKRVEYLTANPIKAHPVKYVIDVIKKLQFPTDHYYVGKTAGRIVTNHYDAHTFRTESSALKAARKLQRSPNLAHDIHAFKVSSIRL